MARRVSWRRVVFSLFPLVARRALAHSLVTGQSMVNQWSPDFKYVPRVVCPCAVGRGLRLR